MTDDVVVTDAEWRAIFLGARVLREVGDGLRTAGAGGLAAECHDQADVLENLGRRAVVAPFRDHDAERGDAEAER